MSSWVRLSLDRMNPRERFKKWREKQKLTAEQTAKQIGCCRSYVYELERNYSGNDVYPSRRLALRIQEKTGIPAIAWFRAATAKGAA